MKIMSHGVVLVKGTISSSEHTLPRASRSARDVSGRRSAGRISPRKSEAPAWRNPPCEMPETALNAVRFAERGERSRQRRGDFFEGARKVSDAYRGECVVIVAERARVFPRFEKKERNFFQLSSGKSTGNFGERAG